MSTLSEAEIQSALQALPGWTYFDRSIQRTFEFSTFSDAMVFVNRVAELAEEADHHPDIDIRYNKVKLTLTSHDSGGVTKQDTRLAKKIADLQEK